jgi:Zn ribbon nucleic-acid-binding protein
MAVSYDHPPSPDFSAFPNIERTYCPQTLEIKNLSTLASWREKSCHSLDCVEVLARQWRETSEIVQLPVEAHRTFSDSEPPDVHPASLQMSSPPFFDFFPPRHHK